MSAKTTDVVSAASLSLWRVALLAVTGRRHDYTTESLDRAVLLLAVPMVLAMLADSLFVIVNIFWVSRLGSEAVAVVGLTEAVMSLIYAVAIGMSFAATAIVARRVGENDALESAARSAGQVIVLGLIVSTVLGLVLAVFAAEILRALGADPTVVALGTDFARVMFATNATVFLVVLINAIFRGAGDAVLAMRVLWLANGINVVLAPCFIFGWGPFPQLGVTGAAVATALSRGIGVLYQVWILTGARSRVRVRLRHLKPVARDLKLIMSTSASGVAQLVISTTSGIGLFSIAALSGTVVLAGCTIAMRVVQFAMLPAFGLAQAAATLVGQNLGAGAPERAAQAVRIAARLNVIFLGAVGALLFVLAAPIAGLFTAEPLVLEEATLALRIVSIGFPLYAAGMCMEAAFNGAGETSTPARLHFFCFWLGRIPLAWLLAVVFEFGAIGVYIAVPVSFAALALWSAILFMRGSWKKHRL